MNIITKEANVPAEIKEDSLTKIFERLEEEWNHMELVKHETCQFPMPTTSYGNLLFVSKNHGNFKTFLLNLMFAKMIRSLQAGSSKFGLQKIFIANQKSCRRNSLPKTSCMIQDFLKVSFSKMKRP